MTKVKFYMENKNTAFAYFPEMEYYAKGYGFDERMRSCYSHVGQHSSCHPDYLKSKKLATIEQYADLLSELKGQGYDDLIVLNKGNEGYTIFNKTILIPEIIAEGAFWDGLEASKIPADPERDYKLQQKCVPLLVERADFHFKNDKLFRKQITSNEKGRNTLWAFMTHWTQSLLKDYKKLLT